MDLRIGDAESKRASKTYGTLPVARMATGSWMSIPVHMVTGADDGPTLCLISTIHGWEFFTVEVLRKAWEMMRPEEISGKVVILPLANPLAFESYTHCTPVDMRNLNGVFPGRPDGWATDRIAHSLVSEVLPRIDCIVDFHSGTLDSAINYTYIKWDGPEKSSKQEHLCRQFGSEVLYRGPGFGTTITEYALSKYDIPAVVALVGGGSLEDGRMLNDSVRGIFNIMKALGMLKGTPELPKKQIIITERDMIQPRFGGMYYPEVGLEALCSVIKGGTVLGRIVAADSFEELETLRAPYEESLPIMVRHVMSRVNPGDYSYIIGDAKTAVVLEN
jgi:hypothetical protein